MHWYIAHKCQFRMSMSSVKSYCRICAIWFMIVHIKRGISLISELIRCITDFIITPTVVKRGKYTATTETVAKKNIGIFFFSSAIYFIDWHILKRLKLDLLHHCVQFQRFECGNVYTGRAEDDEKEIRCQQVTWQNDRTLLIRLETAAAKKKCTKGVNAMNAGGEITGKIKSNRFTLDELHRSISCSASENCIFYKYKICTTFNIHPFVFHFRICFCISAIWCTYRECVPCVFIQSETNINTNSLIKPIQFHVYIYIFATPLGHNF